MNRKEFYTAVQNYQKNSFEHAAKGSTWKDHKYIRKEGNRYIYPGDPANGSTIASKTPISTVKKMDDNAKQQTIESDAYNNNKPTSLDKQYYSYSSNKNKAADEAIDRMSENLKSDVSKAADKELDKLVDKETSLLTSYVMNYIRGTKEYDKLNEKVSEKGEENSDKIENIIWGKSGDRKGGEQKRAIAIDQVMTQLLDEAERTNKQHPGSYSEERIAELRKELSDLRNAYATKAPYASGKTASFAKRVEHSAMTKDKFDAAVIAYKNAHKG